MELPTPGLLGSLITNLTSDFHFSKWRIQYGGHDISETLRLSQNSVLGSFLGRWLQILNWIFRIPYSGSNMANIKFRNLSRFIKILCLDVSEVSVHDSDFLRSAQPRCNDVVVVEFCLLRGAWLEWVPLPLIGIWILLVILLEIRITEWWFTLFTGNPGPYRTMRIHISVRGKGNKESYYEQNISLLKVKCLTR